MHPELDVPPCMQVIKQDKKTWQQHPVTCKHENVVRIGGEIGLLFNWLGLEPTVSSFSFGSKNVKIRSGEKVEKPET